MDPLFAAGSALVVSLAVIPIMIRLAPMLRLIDEPNARKVHVRPIPRVGGWGICIGTLTAILLWLPIKILAASFIIGASILLLAGAADDIFELQGNTKLLLQLVAVIPVVIFADLGVDILPLVEDIHLPSAPGLALAALGLVVCINATNTSDGLDGLAAGSTLLSLFGVLFLAFTAEVHEVLIMAAAALGGLIGFLRYNTHPAIIFMGDLGSQFLGFALGFLALALMRSDVSTISPWALLLVIGLPIADIVVVAARRLIARKPLFKADKTHIHHRFMGLGFSHTQSVVAFYALQGSFIFFGVALRNSEAWKIALVYALHVAAIYGFLHLAEASLEEVRGKWLEANGQPQIGGEPRQMLLWVPRLVVETVLPLVLITGAAISTEVTRDFGILGALLLTIVAVRQFSPRLRSTSATRVPVFLVASAVLYVYTNNRPFISTVSWIAEIACMVLLASMALAAVRFSPKRRKEEFRTTAMDSLLIVFAILAIIAFRFTPSAFNPYYLIYLPVVLYTCELLMIERRRRTSWFPPAPAFSAAILAVRGLFTGI
jgi:UDP-GlcNAc:undecaprenyl-phosphate GlcNAc-1-phosphate transferase